MRVSRNLAAFAAVALLCLQVHAGTDGSPARRIVAISPAAVEIIYKLGAGERLVGISDFADFPACAKKEKPTVGGILNIDVEKILSLKPDLIISNVSVLAKEKIGSLGIRVEFIPDKTLADVRNSFLRIGALVGRPEKAKALAAKISGAVAAAREKSKHLQPVKTLVVIGHEPLWVAGGYGFLNEILEAAGGRNVAGNVARDFYGVDLERVLAARPEVIVDLTLENVRDKTAQRAALSFWKRLEGTLAVGIGRVRFIDSDLLTIPGPRLVEGLRKLQDALRPAPPTPLAQQTSPAASAHPKGPQ